MQIAFLGLGQMGQAVSRTLGQRGHSMSVWNRDRRKAEALAGPGFEVASTPADAVKAAEIVFTMLTDDAAVEAVVFGPPPKPSDKDKVSGFLSAMPRNAVHVCLSTIGVDLARRLEAAHTERGQSFVGAPVFGRPAIAEQGKLWIVAAGEEGALARVRPVLESISRGLTIVSDQPWRAHALKLGGNFMITAMNQTLSEAFVFARSQGLDPYLFHETVNNALFQSKLYESYGRIILDPPEHPGATVTLGSKDTRLFREAAREAKTRSRLADYFAEIFARAQAAGFADSDWAVGQYRVAEIDGPVEES